MPTAENKEQQQQPRKRRKKLKGVQSQKLPKDSDRYLFAIYIRKSERRARAVTARIKPVRARTYNSFIPPNPLWQSIGE